MFQFQGHCLISYGESNLKNSFFTDGFDILLSLETIIDAKLIKVKKALIEEGEGKTYKELDSSRLFNCESFSELIDILKNCSDNLFIHKLEIELFEFSIEIYDNRDFTISTHKNETILKTYLIKLFASCFKFSTDISECVLDEIFKNSDVYYSINSKGIIINKYKDFEEYVDSVL